MVESLLEKELDNKSVSYLINELKKISVLPLPFDMLTLFKKSIKHNVNNSKIIKIFCLIAFYLNKYKVRELSDDWISYLNDIFTQLSPRHIAMGELSEAERKDLSTAEKVSLYYFTIILRILLIKNNSILKIIAYLY